MTQMQFTAPGPVANAFLMDRSEVSAILGPMGSGKTSTVIMKFVAMAQQQAASPLPDKRFPGKRVRYTKVGVVRETMTNLKRTTIKSIKTWFGDQGKWFGGGSSPEPLSFQAHFDLGDGTVAELIFEFIGLDGNNIEDLAKGWEITHYWLNEGDLLNPDIKDFLDGRIGRYPSKVNGGCSFYCGIIDYNAPDTENYLYKIFEETHPEGHKLFRQQGGRDPAAENLHNLPGGRTYYDRMARGKEDWWIRRNIDAQYTFSRDGEPVYEQYNDNLHCGSREFAADPDRPIVLYCDAETHPAMIFKQTTAFGQVIILDEIHIRGGAKQLAEAALHLLATRYSDCRYTGGLVDPSAARMDAKDSDSASWIDTLSIAMGLRGEKRFRAAPTNDPSKRQDAVKELLTTLIDGQPALLVSSRAKIARKGFNSTYCFKKQTNGVIQDKPTKDHPVSDVHDAIQYMALDDGGYQNVMAREKRQRQQADFSKPRVMRQAVQI